MTTKNDVTWEGLSFCLESMEVALADLRRGIALRRAPAISGALQVLAGKAFEGARLLGRLDQEIEDRQDRNGLPSIPVRMPEKRVVVLKERGARPDLSRARREGFLARFEPGMRERYELAVKVAVEGDEIHFFFADGTSWTGTLRAPRE